MNEIQKTNALIRRALANMTRYSQAGDKENAKRKFDEAWKLMHEAGEKNVDAQLVTNIHWVRENYHDIKSRNWKNTNEPKWMQRKFERMEADHAGL